MTKCVILYRDPWETPVFSNQSLSAGPCPLEMPARSRRQRADRDEPSIVSLRGIDVANMRLLRRLCTHYPNQASAG